MQEARLRLIQDRSANRHLRFDVGSITALDLSDAAAGGVLAWYSTIHTPPSDLPGVLAEFSRVLAPGRYLLWSASTSETDSGEP